MKRRRKSCRPIITRGRRSRSSKGIHRGRIHLDDDRRVAIDQRKDLLAWALPPFGAPVEGILARLTVLEAVVRADEIVGGVVVGRRSKGNDVDLPPRQHWKRRFANEAMKLVP